MSSVTRYKISASAYPRFKYAIRYVRPLVLKSRRTLKDCGIKDDIPLPELRNVTINVQEPSGRVLIDPEWLVPNEKSLDDTQMERMPISDFMDSAKETEFGYSLGGSALDPMIFVADLSDFQKTGEIPKHYGRYIILISEEETANQVAHCPGLYINISSKEKFAETANRLLEHIVFDLLKERIQVLLTIGQTNFLEDFQKKSQAYIMQLYGDVKKIGRQNSTGMVDDVKSFATTMTRQKSFEVAKTGLKDCLLTGNTTIYIYNFAAETLNVCFIYIMLFDNIA